MEKAEAQSWGTCPQFQFKASLSYSVRTYLGVGETQDAPSSTYDRTALERASAEREGRIIILSQFAQIRITFLLMLYNIENYLFP